ncbi:MAG: hypothetical protein K2W99_08500 [Chthoniobacterales bacterium]|nr:hypothetical protein [Chthoniobacterales bacterium]
MSIPRLPNLVLTCASKGSTRSGIESQLQKIYSTYALSRFLDVSFFHLPRQQYADFSHVNRASAVEREETSGLTHRYDELFHIPFDRELPAGGMMCHLPSAELGVLCNLRDKAKREPDSFYLVEIISTQQIVEKHPRMLHYIKEVSPFESSNSLPLKIAIHARHGDLLEPEKALPNSFYVTVTQQVIKKLQQLNLPFVCELHMEIASQMLAPSLQGLPFDKNVFKPNLASSYESLTKEFDALPNLKKFINHNPLSSLQSLATADLLLTSCYSLSYLAALLNKRGLIVYHPFLEHPLPGWINATNPETINQKIAHYAERVS